MRSVAALVVVIACGAAFADEPAPSDDPTGRVTTSYRAELLVVPRLVLALPRATIHLLGGAVHGVLVVNERYRIYQRVLDALTSADGLVGVRPAADLALDYRPLFGLSFFDERDLGPAGGLYARAETGGPDLVIASALARLRSPRRRSALEIEASYLLRDDQVFRAISSLGGPDTGNSRYALSAFDLFLRPTMRVARGTTLGLTTQLGSRRYDDGRAGGDPPISEGYCLRVLGQCVPGTVDDRFVPGFHDGADFVRAGPTLQLDLLDRPTRTTAGARLSLGATYSHGLHDDSSYTQLWADLAVAIDLWQQTHILLLRLAGAMVLPISGTVAFSELATLGGVDSMRGFRAGRFRDFSTVMVAAEYRWPIWIWADALLFVDYGGAAGEAFAGFGLDKLRPDIGAGIRVLSSDHVYARLQLAYGFPDGLQLSLSFGAAP